MPDELIPRVEDALALLRYAGQAIAPAARADYLRQAAKQLAQVSRLAAAETTIAEAAMWREHAQRRAEKTTETA